MNYQKSADSIEGKLWLNSGRKKLGIKQNVLGEFSKRQNDLSVVFKEVNRWLTVLAFEIC
jgi:hypothetical protein